jgi:hypothetical protein
VVRPLLLLPLLALLAGCAEDARDPRHDQAAVARNDVESLGSLSGEFACTLFATDDVEFDLGPAHWEGDVEHTAYTVGLRTQGCFARLFEVDRGWVASVTMFQQLSYTLAQVLELDFPIDPNGDGELLQPGEDVVMSGNDGFGSIYLLNREPVDQSVIVRVAGGVVTLDEAGLTEGSVLSGSFNNLRVGAVN